MWRASSWGKTVTTGSPARKSVLMIIAERTDDWGYSSAGQHLIAEEAEVGYRSVQRYVAELADMGLLTIYQARGRDGRSHNLYRLGHEVKPRDPLPEDHLIRSPRYRWSRGPARRPEDIEAGAAAPLPDADPDANLSHGPDANLAHGPPANLAHGSAEPHANGDQAARQSLASEPVSNLSLLPSSVSTSEESKGAAGAPGPPPVAIINLSLIVPEDGDWSVPLFRQGLAWLASVYDKKPDRLRSLIGHWLKLTGTDHQRVYSALADAQRDGRGDPASWITTLLGGKHGRSNTETGRGAFLAAARAIIDGK